VQTPFLPTNHRPGRGLPPPSLMSTPETSLLSRSTPSPARRSPFLDRPLPPRGPPKPSTQAMDGPTPTTTDKPTPPSLAVCILQNTVPPVSQSPLASAARVWHNPPNVPSNVASSLLLLHPLLVDDGNARLTNYNAPKGLKDIFTYSHLSFDFILLAHRIANHHSFHQSCVEHCNTFCLSL